MTGMRRLLAWLAVLALLEARSAAAAETDYLPDNPSWNGLSELADLARGLQLQVVLLEELNWNGLPPRSTLLVVYPRAAIEPLDLMGFVGRGGKALIADDHGEARALLAKLGVDRRDGVPVRGARVWNGNANLPIASAHARHPLVTGIGDVVCNHPASFRSRFPTLLGWDEEQQLMVAGRLGHGSFVALSDPSVLINGMLRFEGNLTLVTNLLRQLAPEEGNTVYLVTGSFRVQGHTVPMPPERAASPAQRFMTEYNSFLALLNNYAATAPALRSLAFVCGALALVALILVLPLPRRELDGHWLRPRGGAVLGLEDQVRRSRAARRLGRASLPAGLLREEIEEILTELLHAPAPITTIHPSWVVSEVRRRAGEDAAQLCRRLLAALRRVPAGREPGLPERLIGRVGERELARVYELGRDLLARLGGPELPPTHDRPPARE